LTKLSQYTVLYICIW